MEIYEVLTNLKNFDCWDFKSYSLSKAEAEAIIDLLDKPKGIEYYAIENTIDEYGHTQITGKYETYVEAKEGLKNKYNYFRDRGTGKIIKIKQWFEGFELKENKRVIYERIC